MPDIPLHSNLVLFKSSGWCNYKIYIRALHSNLVLFKFIFTIIFTQLPSLYIPIWFYSNSYSYSITGRQKSFTFQSGSIQINGYNSKRPCGGSFTFQSGSIQIQSRKKEAKDFRKLYIPIWFYSNWELQRLRLRIYSLHSNLVLFKWSALQLLCSP